MTDNDNPGFGEAPQAQLMADGPIERRPGTRAADGFERVQWTVDDLERLARAGVFGDDKKIELIEGGLLPRAPKTDEHDDPKNRLARQLTLSVGPDVMVASENSFRLNRINWYDPDIIVFPDAMKPSQVRGPDALLVIESSASSIDRDRK